jgi:hypothetical protein
MNKIEINAALIELDQKFEECRAVLATNWKEDALLYHDLMVKIHRVLSRLLTFQMLKKDGENAIWEALEERADDNKVKEMVAGWIEDAKRLKSYNPLNFFVALRLYERKRREIRYKYNGIHNELSRLQRQYGEISDQVAGMHGPFAERIIGEIHFKNQWIEELKRVIYFENTSFREQIEQWFAFNKLRKSDFLSLITTEKRLRHWDGEPNRTNEMIAKLPDEMDFETFQRAVFIEKIEHDEDCYLFDQFMFSVLEFSDKNPGRISDLFQEIFGPIPTYTVQTDEFGRVVKVEPAKPDLKLVH